MAAEGSPTEAGSIEQRLLTFLRAELLEPDADVGRDTALLSGDLLDSVSVLRLAAWIQDEFLISLPPADFTAENFRSVATIAAYVQRSGQSAPPGPAAP